MIVRKLLFLVVVGCILDMSLATVSIAMPRSISVSPGSDKVVAFTTTLLSETHTLTVQNGAAPCLRFKTGSVGLSQDADLPQWIVGPESANSVEIYMAGAEPASSLWLAAQGEFERTLLCQAGGGGGAAPVVQPVLEPWKGKVPDVKLMTPTQNQEFHLDMDGPTMPTVTLSVVVEPNIAGIQYRFEVGNNARALEYEDAPAPAVYAHPGVIDSGWVNNAAWNITFGNQIYGGHVTHIKVTIKKGNEVHSRVFERDFWILGGALTPALRNGYIEELNNYDANIRKMAKAIAIAESGGTHYWAGGAVGTASHVRYPQRELLAGGVVGTGWGVMQLDNASGLVDRNTIWNWKKNIDAGMAYIKLCYNKGVAYLNQHPNGPPVVDGTMQRLEGYERYNAGEDTRYHWWNAGGCNVPAGCGAAPAATGWIKFGYKACPGGATHGERDYNNDGQADCNGNPFCIPNGPTTPNDCRGRGERYADNTILLEP